MILRWIFLLFTFSVEGDKITIEVSYPGELCPNHFQDQTLQPAQKANSVETKCMHILIFHIVHTKLITPMEYSLFQLMASVGEKYLLIQKDKFSLHIIHTII